jgi:hypothetical protein
MFKCLRGLLLLIPASLAYGQLNFNAVTVTSSQNANLQPDQAVFAVTVTSPLNTALNDVVAALQGSGIGLANFSGVSVLGGQAALQWNFALTAPLDNTKGTVATLIALQQSVAAKNSSLALSFSIQGTQVSQQAQQSQPCVISSLLSDARSQAQTLAAASGRALGRIMAMLSSTSNTTAGSSQPSAPPPCTVTVTFAVIGN